MGNRTATYVAFAAQGMTDPTKSDIKYFNLLKAWREKDSIDFSFVDAHEKTSQCRDSSTFETITRRLRERLDCSKNLLLLTSSSTKLDNDFVPYEVEYAMACEMPILVCYLDIGGRSALSDIKEIKKLWPEPLKKAIDEDIIKTIHFPFYKNIILEAINYFKPSVQPKYTVTVFTDAVYKKFGL